LREERIALYASSLIDCTFPPRHREFVAIRLNEASVAFMNTVGQRLNESQTMANELVREARETRDNKTIYVLQHTIVT